MKTTTQVWVDESATYPSTELPVNLPFDIDRIGYKGKNVQAILLRQDGTVIEIAQQREGIAVIMYRTHTQQRVILSGMLSVLQYLFLVTKHQFTILHNSITYGDKVIDLYQTPTLNYSN